MSSLFSVDQFDRMYAMAVKFVGTKESPNEMVPKNYQGNPSAFLIALEIAQKTGETVLGVMQNLSVIQGRPGWSSKYMIGKINSSGKYHGGLRFCLSAVDEKETDVEYTEWQWDKSKNKSTPLLKKTKIKNQTCYAYAYDSRTGAEIRGITVDLVMAIKEGWYFKSGSKWQTMTQLMLQYRTASFFASFYIPELLFGVPTVEEIEDGILLEESPLRSPSNVAVAFKRTYADIESALKTMNLTLRVEADDGRIWAIVQGKSFPYQSDLNKLGFETNKTSNGFQTRLDVTHIDGVPEVKGQGSLELAHNLTSEQITSLPLLKQYVLENGYAMEIANKGDKVYAKLDIDPSIDQQKRFAFSLGFSASPKGIIKDVTELALAS